MLCKFTTHSDINKMAEAGISALKFSFPEFFCCVNFSVFCSWYQSHVNEIVSAILEIAARLKVEEIVDRRKLLIEEQPHVGEDIC